MSLNFIGQMLCLVSLLSLSPVLRSQNINQVLTAGYGYPAYTQAAYGQIMTLFVPALAAPNATASGFPLQTSLTGVSVSVKAPPTAASNYPSLLPMLSVYTVDPAFRDVAGPSPVTEITVQIPTEAACTGASCTLVLNVQAGGVSGPDFTVVLSQSNLHFLNTCDVLLVSTALSAAGCRPSVTHADGSYVTADNPAVAGETVVIYALGLGPTTPSVPTGQPAPTPAPVVGNIPQLSVSHWIDLPATMFARYVPDSQLAMPSYAGLVSGYAGLYQINVQVPALPTNAHVCSTGTDANTRFASIDGNGNPLESFDICVRAN